MTTIWKYELDVTDIQAVPMPEGAVIRHVGQQNGQLCVWAEVNASAPSVDLLFEIIGTGNPMPARNRTYRGSVQVGIFVWHVYTVDGR
jgi:hypothetical protein